MRLAALVLGTCLLKACAAAPCDHDVLGQYGAGAATTGGFAELVEVACAGQACFDEAAVYSEIAIAERQLVADGVPMDHAACRALCSKYDECQLWTLTDGAACELKRLMPWGPTVEPGVAFASGDPSEAPGVRSGPERCGDPYLPFPDGLAPVEATDMDDLCYVSGMEYGGAQSSCPAELLAVHGAEDVLAVGANQGWWTESQAVPGGEVDEAAACQALCAAHEGCAGFTLSHGLCRLLAAPVGCSRVFDMPPITAIADDVLSGYGDNCTNPLELANLLGLGWYGMCDTPRCTLPIVDMDSAYFDEDTLRSGDGCYLDIGVLSSPSVTAPALSGKWVVVAGASNGGESVQ